MSRRLGGRPVQGCRRFVTSAAVFLAICSAALLMVAGWRASSVGAHHAEVHPEVVRSLQAVDSVYVLVVLDEAGNGAFRSRGHPERFNDIRAAQAQVLVGVTQDDFLVSHRYRNIPALAGWATEAGVHELADQPGVAAIDIVREGAGGLDSSLPFIGADSAHATGLTGRGVRVAVVDSGVDTDHPDLRKRVVDQVCFVTTSSGCGPAPDVAEDDHGHGTNVTGIVASGGTVAPRGVAPEAEIVAVKVINDRNRYITPDLLSALDWLIERDDIQIVNMSLGTFATYSGVCDEVNATTRAYATAIETLRQQGVISFACSMNERSSEGMGAPACTSAAVSVGAVYDSPPEQADQVWPRSNSDATLDLLGPGVGVRSTGLNGGISSFSGTSQATPHVSGLAALLLSVDPELGPDDIVRLLTDTGVPVLDARNGVTVPRIDARAALERIGVVLTPAPPTPTPTDTPILPTKSPNDTPAPTRTGIPRPTHTPTARPPGLLVPLYLPLLGTNQEV